MFILRFTEEGGILKGQNYELFIAIFNLHVSHLQCNFNERKDFILFISILPTLRMSSGNHSAKVLQSELMDKYPL